MSEESKISYEDNFKGWSVNAKIKFGDTGAGVSAKLSGTGYSVSTSGTSGTMPLPLPNGTQIDDLGSINWSLSYSGEVGNWKNMLEAVATAGAIVGLIFSLFFQYKR